MPENAIARWIAEWQWQWNLDLPRKRQVWRMAEDIAIDQAIWMYREAR